jgi:hypothetical protein
MKRILVALLAIMAFTPLTAQKEEVSSFSKSYVVKIAPAGYWLGKIGIGGEYNFRNKKSLTLNIGIPAEKSLKVSIDDEKRNLKIKTLSAMAGYRMYLGKNPMKGFYLEPFLKYVDNEFVTTTTVEIDGSDRPFVIASEYSGFGVGAQLGVQFMIAKKVVLDFYFLGPEGNLSKHNLLAQETGAGLPWSTSEAEEAEQEIENFIDDIPFLKDNEEVSVNALQRNVRMKFDGFLPGFRLGLSIGIRF